MKRKFVFISILLSLFFSAKVLASDLCPDQSILSVSGSGIVKAKPNNASLNINVSTKGKTANEAVSANSALTQKLINTLQKAGLSEDDIQTNNYSVTPLYKNTSQGFDGSTIVGYEVNNNVTATVHKISDTGSLIDSISATGNYTINGISFGLEETTELEADALKKAISDARKKADIAATAAGKTITGIKSLIVGNSFSSPRFADGPTAAVAETQINPGNISVSSNVSIEYLLSK